MVAPVTSPVIVPQQANDAKPATAATEGGVKKFQDHMNAQPVMDGHRVNKVVKSTNVSDLKSSKSNSRLKLNQLQNSSDPKGDISGTEIAIKAREIAKEFEAYFLKEMWKDIDGLKFSGGQDMDMVFDIWSEKLIEDWFSPREGEEGGELARQMSEQLIAKYRKYNPQLTEE